MDRWIGKTALVTGASAGIGATIAKALVLAGLEVVGLARRVELIEALAESLKGAKGKLHAIKCDLTNEAEILKAFEWINKELGGIDVLVNNAGVLPSITPIAEASTEDFQRTLNVNLLAVAICTREAMKSMRSRDTEGHIFFLSSVVGYNLLIWKTPLGMYPTSKFALRGFVKSVKLEIDAAKDKIRTTTIIPGLVKTEIVDLPGGGDVVFKNNPYIETEHIADSIVYALSAPPHVCIDEMKITPMHRK